jgi:hypothetical protein
MAAWLSGLGRTGIGPGDLAALRVPRRVTRILGVLPPEPARESAASHAERVRSCAGAGLVLLAPLTDRYRTEALSRIPSHRADRERDLLRSLGMARLLAHYDERVRDRSAAALGKIGDPAPAAQLEAVLDDVSPPRRPDGRGRPAASTPKQVMAAL